MPMTALKLTVLSISDIFHSRVQPSKMFDVLKEDFEHWLIASVVLSMLVASFITQKLASRKALNRQWKWSCRLDNLTYTTALSRDGEIFRYWKSEVFSRRCIVFKNCVV